MNGTSERRGGGSSPATPCVIVMRKVWKVIPGCAKKPCVAPVRLAVIARTTLKIGCSPGSIGKIVPPARYCAALIERFGLAKLRSGFEWQDPHAAGPLTM